MQKKSFSQVFAERLRLLREAQGFSQQDMATVLNVCRSTYTRYENASSSPSLELTRQIARILQADLRYLFQMPPETGGQLADRKQEDDGVTTPSLPETEKRLLQYFRSLTPEQQTALLEQITLRSIEPLPDEPKFNEE
ncbi:MAG: helix-turn-helix transcriptional regulator [Clostridia bacterium]|nr:helix-turn-helix transcriptional regulator [Clostridia bacterium]